LELEFIFFIRKNRNKPTRSLAEAANRYFIISSSVYAKNEVIVAVPHKTLFATGETGDARVGIREIRIQTPIVELSIDAV